MEFNTAAAFWSVSILFIMTPGADWRIIVPMSSWSAGAQILALGMIHIVSCGAAYFLVGFAAQAILKSRPHAAQFTGRVSGGLMIVIALLPAVDRIKEHIPFQPV